MNDDFHPYLVLYHRRTGQIVGRPVRIPDEEYPFRVPPENTALIRYIDFWKLEDMITTGEMYFCRADKLEDHLEGRYAEANKNYLTLAYQNFLTQFNGMHETSALVMQNNILRSEVFINCWQMMDSERLHMWSTFTTTAESVAICSTFRQLSTSLPQDKRFSAAMVRYLDQSVPRPEWHSLAPFYAKDPQFTKEKELRITFAQCLEDAHTPKSAGFMRVKTQIRGLVNKVILHPAAPSELNSRVRQLFRKAQAPIRVRGSAFSGQWKTRQQPPCPRIYRLV